MRGGACDSKAQASQRLNADILVAVTRSSELTHQGAWAGRLALHLLIQEFTWKRKEWLVLGCGFA